jgi:hypothetical protein
VRDGKEGMRREMGDGVGRGVVKAGSLEGNGFQA